MPANFRPKPPRITTRIKPCGCGCKGADSWHKPTIRRVIRNQEAVGDGASDWTGNRRVIRRGVAKMPWGPEPVVAWAWVFEDGSLGSPDWWLERVPR